MALHNRVNNRLLKKKLRTTTEARITLSFYRYTRIDHPHALRDAMYKGLANLGVMGRIYLAEEGINAQVSLAPEKMTEFADYLYSIPAFSGLHFNAAIDDDGKSFFKLKILVRKKIVADGLNDRSFDVTDCGTKLDAEQFNTLVEQPGSIVVDMRNHYESEIGHFQGAVCPDADTFREALPIVEKLLKGKENQPVIMYCTGGIRCEKASAWMKHVGFSQVYQLEGGIIEYARQVKARSLPNLFIGKNFVFDERMGERITEEVISVCHQCGKPCDTHTNCHNDGCHLLFIQCEACARKYEGCCSEACREILQLPPEEQKALRSGRAQSRKVFRKGRSAHLHLG